MSNDDDVNVQFVFDDDTDDLLILCEKPMMDIRLKRVDADCLYALLATRFGKPPHAPGALSTAYLATIDTDDPIKPGHEYKVFISHTSIGVRLPSL